MVKWSDGATSGQRVGIERSQLTTAVFTTDRDALKVRNDGAATTVSALFIG